MKYKILSIIILFIFSGCSEEIGKKIDKAFVDNNETINEFVNTFPDKNETLNEEIINKELNSSIDNNQTVNEELNSSIDNNQTVNEEINTSIDNNQTVNEEINTSIDNNQTLNEETNTITDNNQSIKEVLPLTIEEKTLLRTNKIRNTVFTDANMTWNDGIAQTAQNYADSLAQSGKFEHDGSSSFGENLYASSSSKSTYLNAMDDWENEKFDYHYDTNSCNSGKQCGHYTQIIWKNSTEMGCGIAIYKVGNLADWTIIVCRYNPPGNVFGQKPYF